MYHRSEYASIPSSEDFNSEASIEDHSTVEDEDEEESSDEEDNLMSSITNSAQIDLLSSIIPEPTISSTILSII